MAMFRLEAKIFSREKRGRSVVAAAAYRDGKKLKDELHNKTFDYTRREKGVVSSTILAPEGAPAWAFDPGQLWNTVEKGEKRSDAQLAREFILAVPPELSPDAQFQTARNWVKNELVNSGMIAEISLHHSKSGTNPHVHVLCTLRKLDGETFSAKKPREWNDIKLLMHQRESWAAAVNAALEKAGCDERVDHRSLKDQGIDRLPQPKIGVDATAMKRRGVLEDPERCKAVRAVQMMNEVLSMLKGIRTQGEVRQAGVGASWWERSITFMSRVREHASEAVKGTWQKLLQSRGQRKDKNGPEIEM